jgi:hypothetical protein
MGYLTKDDQSITTIVETFSPLAIPQCSFPEAIEDTCDWSILRIVASETCWTPIKSLVEDTVRQEILSVLMDK